MSTTSILSTRDEERYQGYEAYCLLVGSPVRDREWWLQHADNLDTARADRLREFGEAVA